MKVLLINTFDRSGGAAVACQRLLRALTRQGIEAKLLAQEQTRPDPLVVPVARTGLGRKIAWGRFLLDRLEFYYQEKDKSARFAFSPAHVGTDISRHPAVQEADILHLHWVYFGFLSITSLKKLFQLGKPIVWTLHDMWAFTGGCHYSGGCLHYQTHCHNCPFLRKPQARDLAWRIFEEKIALFKGANVQFVTCSKWLASAAGGSALLGHFPITAIPNPIDTGQYQPEPKQAARRKLQLPEGKELILFGAMNTREVRKGFAYLSEALHVLKTIFPRTTEHVELVVFGKSDPKALSQLPFPVHNRGRISSDQELIHLYNACDVTVLPSLEDNLPNTVMESLACGTPVVAFRTGGLPEMIRHEQNGYLARYQSAEDLADGIHKVLYKYDPKRLRETARTKVVADFSEPLVAGHYQTVYEKLLR